MTLYKQLSSLIFTVFFLVVIALSVGQMQEAQRFIDSQMRSELNNSSQALTLMLQPAMEQADHAATDAMITALFETGLYQRIELKWLVDGKLQEWHNDSVDEQVPQWFRQLPLFNAASQQTTIVSGWLQLGQLTIYSHPGFAYRQIWESLWVTTVITSVMLLVMLTLAKWWLKQLLKPLGQVQQRAAQVADQQFGEPMSEPRSHELALLVRSINRMESRLKLQFDAHSQQVSQLQHTLMTDAVTGLANRQHLNARLDSWLAEAGDGALVLIKLPLLEQLRQQFGYQLRDELLQRFSHELQQLAEQHQGVACRINANELAVLAEGLQPLQQLQLGKAISQLLHKLSQSCGLDEPQACAAGAISRHPEHNRQQLLSEADQALRQSEQSGQPLHWFAELNQQGISVEQWRSLLDHDLGQRLSFYRQPVMDINDHHLHHHELFGRLRHQGKEYNAFQFLPYLDLIGRAVAFDRALIEQLLSQPQLLDPQQPLAINLTAAAANDEGFVQWLLSQLRAQRYPLLFEISESMAINASDTLLRLRAELREAGYRFGIDHFGRELGALDYLQRLHPDYVRLDRGFSSDHNQAAKPLCQALCLTAEGLEIDIYLTGIENLPQLAHWQELKLSGYQGFIEPPQPFGSALSGVELSD